MAIDTITIKDAAQQDKKVVVDNDGAGNLTQVNKLGFSADDTAPTIVERTAPLPVDVMAGSDVKFAVINTSSSGDNPIVGAVATKKIRVIAFTLIADSSVSIQWKRATTAITGAMVLTTGGGMTPYCPQGLFETATNEALNLNVSAAVGIRGFLTYREI